ncbi:MAG: pseudouridine synthase [Bacteroidales bacterium]|nr:pseudouridine synthase [Bacteroidales bacterium]
MEEKMNGGYESHEERRDYAGNEGRRNGYSTEGRKLRPRRKVAPSASSERDGEYKPYNSNNDRRGSYQSRGGYQDRPRYNQDRRERPSYGQDRRSSFSQDRNGYGQDRPRYNQDRRERPAYGQDRRERPSYGQDRRSSFSQDRNGYGQDRPRFRDDRQGGHSEGRPSYGKPRSFHDGPKASGFSKGPGRPAPKKPVRKSNSHFTATDEAGINQMLSRKPQVDNPLFSDNDNVPTPIKEEIRLNKFIANSGVCSRREADTLIQAGVVTVNGEVVTELGTKINVLKDDVRFNGERLKGEEKVYIVMNKPKGFVTSASDPHADKTVMDLLKGCTSRVFPVGRLDKNTTGVLMFTNDGEIAEQLTHPSFNKKKIYQVILDKALDEQDKEKILVEGLQLTDGVIKADELEYIDAEDHRRLGIEIHSGKNRIVRRIFESLGYTVKALDRVYFAGLTKKGLKKGEWRYLSEGEVNVLKMGAYV